MRSPRQARFWLGRYGVSRVNPDIFSIYENGPEDGTHQGGSFWKTRNEEAEWLWATVVGAGCWRGRKSSIRGRGKWAQGRLGIRNLPQKDLLPCVFKISKYLLLLNVLVGFHLMQTLSFSSELPSLRYPKIVGFSWSCIRIPSALYWKVGL